jgi:hypothetical protein
MQPVHRRTGFARGCVVAALVTTVALSSCAQASASDTIGQAYSSSGGGPCAGNTTYIQTSYPGNTYAAPYDGVITSWASYGFFASAALKVVRLGAGTSFTVIGSDGPRPATNGVLSIYPVRIAVRQGDVLGVYVPDPDYCPYTGPVGSTSGFAAGDYAVGANGSWSADTRWLPISAQIEHDGDGDGYGDETQDGCPTDPTTHDVCDVFPPETTVTKGPKKKTKSKSATFEFSSSEAGSTFECSLDGAKFSACSSPLKVKVKGFGKHNFLVRARDSHGNLDTSEASWSWKVKKKHKH